MNRWKLTEGALRELKRGQGSPFMIFLKPTYGLDQKRWLEKREKRNTR